MRSPLAPVLLSSLVLAPAAVAQSGSGPLELTVDGGSLPGTLQFRLGSGPAFQTFGLVILSVTTGPTPLSLFDPRDPRSLRVGTELLSGAQGGLFLASGDYSSPVFPVNQPAFIDQGLFLQGLTLPGSGSLFDRISDPVAVWFAPPGQWRDRFASFLNGRAFTPVLDATEGRVLLAGGGSGGLFAQVALNDTQFYDPLTDSFAPGPSMTIERSLHTATRLLDGRWLLAAGVDRSNDPQATAEIWDPVAGAFTAVASMAQVRAGHAAALLPDGRVLVSGGITDLNAPSTPIDPIYSITTSTEIYDPAGDTWTPGPALRRPRAGHHALQRADGNVLLCGGVSWQRILFRLPNIQASTDVFDPATGQISAGPDMNSARAEASVTALGGGSYLLAGGVANITLTQWGTPTASVEIYDATTGAFRSVASMAQRRALHAAYEYGPGRYIHIGGGDGSLYNLTALSGCEIYDVAADTWSPGPALSRPRAAYAHYRTPAGQVHVLGGSSTNGNVENTTEFLDPLIAPGETVP